MKPEDRNNLQNANDPNNIQKKGFWRKVFTPEFWSSNDCSPLLNFFTGADFLFLGYWFSVSGKYTRPSWFFGFIILGIIALVILLLSYRLAKNGCNRCNDLKDKLSQAEKEKEKNHEVFYEKIHDFSCEVLFVRLKDFLLLNGYPIDKGVLRLNIYQVDNNNNVYKCIGRYSSDPHFKKKSEHFLEYSTSRGVIGKVSTERDMWACMSAKNDTDWKTQMIKSFGYNKDDLKKMRMKSLFVLGVKENYQGNVVILEYNKYLTNNMKKINLIKDQLKQVVESVGPFDFPSR